MKTTTFKELEKQYTGTYSVKADTVRGRIEKSFYDLVPGDEVLIDNHFTLIVEEEKQEDKTMENRKYVEGIRKELEAIYNGEVLNDEGEQASFYDYVNDVLDYEMTINSLNEYKSCKLFVTLGGPNVWIDTADQEIKLAWGSERESIWLPSEICEELDCIMEELYNCR